MSCGVNARDNGDRIREAEEKCIKAALKHGVRPRAEINSPEEAKRYIDLGVKDFNIGGELWHLSAAWNKNASGMREVLAQNNL
jgi:2-keto-3-deoxy-L-rhamnonate aldolase RhmA